MIKKQTKNYFSFPKGKLLFIFFFMLCFVVQFTIYSQTKSTIKGIVTDAQTNEPLLGANVIVIGTQIGAATNNKGEYSLQIPPGNYTLQVSYISYKTQKMNVSVLSGQVVTQNFLMESDLLGTQEVVVVGTRVQDRTVVNSPVPIDVLTAQEIQKTGFTSTTELIKLLVPSYNAPQTSIVDGSDHVRPATLRGLGPDQVLVLINGKRRHTSALVHVNGSVGRGSTGADLNAIPISAIERIEVLRDGASAQYGSDAIAGVINIILKEKTGLDVSASYGEYVTTVERGYTESEGLVQGESATTYTWAGKVVEDDLTDGFSKNVHLGYGFVLPNNGKLYLSGEYRKHNFTNRAGYDPRNNYFPLPDGSPDPREATFGRLNHRFGDADQKDISGFLNGSMMLNNSMQLYAFGGFTYREGLSGGFYRLSKDDRNVRAIYPDGFLPMIRSKINDGSVAAGLKGNLSGWNYDLSETFGGNSFKFEVTNSLNTSMGLQSPKEFNAGTLKFYQSTSNLDLVKQVEIGTSAPLNIATGLEFRWENYQIAAGEPSSYENGGVPILDGPNAGKPAAAGAQVFPGFSPVNITDETRTNVGIYFDLENNILPQWTVDIAGRFEHYSDFGSTLTGKFATRYEFIPQFSIRAAISNGFRAPSLAQEYFSAISTNFINGVPYEVGTFPVSSPVAKALGAKDLDAEKSLNISAGFTSTFTNFTLTVDGYFIKITDRIVLTENFVGAGVQNFLESQGINASGGRFFTNALDTETKGIDITARYGFRFSRDLTLRLTAALNFNETNITNEDEIVTPPELQAVTTIPLLGRVEMGRFERGQPLNGWNFMANLTWKDLSFMARTVRFGKYTVYSNSKSPAGIYYDQTFDPVWITDAEISYKIIKGISIAIGSNNIFDVYPDKNIKFNSFNGIFMYNASSPSGYNGRYIYSRFDIAM